MFRILVADKLDQAGLDRLASADDATFDLKTDLDKKELLAIIADYDGLIVRSGTRVDTDAIHAAKKLKVIGRAGIGVDNIDVHAATMAGIVVMNTPNANSIATAEQTLALMLGICRHTASAHASVKAGEWNRAQFTGMELYGKALGIIGFGRVGQLVAERARAFGMEILAYDPFVSEQIGREMGVTLVDLDDLFPHSDFITLHIALLPETENIINARTIKQMKKGVMLINASRGKLVDDIALAKALKSGKVKAAAIDVYRQEPPSKDNPLIGLPNVLHTPHLGANTIEAQHIVATQIVDQVLAALRGADFANSINMPFQVGSGGFAGIRPYMALAEKLGVLHAGMARGKINRVELEVKGDVVTELVRAIAAALLKGILDNIVNVPLNYINAPILANEHGITIAQASGINGLDYPNLITCRVISEGEAHTLAGVLFGGSESRIVQVDQYRLEAKPEGVVLMMQNKDVPGVIGQVGTILSAFDVNIGEWRLGRNQPGGEALSFINLDSVPSEAVLKALSEITAVTRVKLITLIEEN